jgi:hypothetical protein
VTDSGDEQFTRAVILALWPKLVKAEWGPVNTRDLNDYGADRVFKTVATATIPNSPAKHAIITTTRRLALIATTSTHHVLLTETAYARALDRMTDTEHQAHQASLSGQRPPPYRWNTDRHGHSYLGQRLDGWDHTWSRYARAALAKVAQHATTWPAGCPAPELVAS